MKNKNGETDIVNNRKDRSPVIPQRDKIKTQVKIKQLELNDKQKKFMELVMDKAAKIVFVSGPAGTAKTFMAVFAALTGKVAAS